MLSKLEDKYLATLRLLFVFVSWRINNVWSDSFLFLSLLAYLNLKFLIFLSNESLLIHIQSPLESDIKLAITSLLLKSSILELGSDFPAKTESPSFAILTISKVNDVYSFLSGSIAWDSEFSISTLFTSLKGK